MARETVVPFVGEIDVVTAPAMLERLLGCMAADPPASIVVDLEAVTFLDSCGLRALVRAHKAAQACQSDVRVVNARPWVERIFEVSGLHDLFVVNAGGAAPD